MSKIDQKTAKCETIKDICDILFSLEEKYDLNHVQIQGIYIWQLIRIYVYYEISRKIEVFGSPQQGKVTIIDKILSFIPFIKNSLFSNPLSGNYSKKILIFDHPRKVKHEGTYKDIYTHFLIDDLKNIEDSYEVIKSPYLNKHEGKKKKYIKYNDRIFLGSYFYKKITNLKLKTCEKNKIDNLQRELNSQFNIEIDLLNIVKNHILDFKYQYKKYDSLFKKRKTKYVLVVVAYENQALLAAAHSNGIKVIELQHGTISKYHLGYNYPNIRDKYLEYFPDQILSFGEYWKKVANYPIDEKNIIAMGFPYLEKNIEEYNTNSKNKKQILFISQGVIGKELAKFSYNLAKKLNEKINDNLNSESDPKIDEKINKEIDNKLNNEIHDKEIENENYHIIYKLHPGEYSNWRTNYKNLVKAEKLNNFTIIDDNTISLYELFSKSEYQIGVFSTAIYEGLLFNCKTFIVDLPGIEYMDSLVEKNYVKKIDNVDEFIKTISNFKTNSYNRDFFFKKYDKNILKKIFEK
ncbi:hypothetical protein ALNOE001_11460 [Candidatus Methanobinarius endosymbioticus]|uniref:Capsule polysaccharide biosynthesis protein n=1 Tax=Candidatus Methanobinarius endosymbioticus TaxID=2006182 RepID=A0A366MAS6_9EURY|nr:hypothetical protein ALNOE001_11460 [Candidatus Methanobinarius endosymbioticus]